MKRTVGRASARPLDGRFDGICKVYLPALRHRVLLNFEAHAENVLPDAVLTEILGEVKEKAEDTR